MSQVIRSLSLVVPAYNEEDIIEETLKIYAEKLKRLVKSYEIIVIDDGSTDRTLKILKKLKTKYRNLKVIIHKKNMGVGKALIDGFKASKSHWVMHNSADRPFDINDLHKAQKLFDDFDVIVVVREDRSANSLFRKITSFTSFLLVKLFFGTSIHDFHFIQIYKREVLKNIKISSHDTFMPAELLVNLSRKGYNIAEFRSKFHKRMAGQSKYNNPIRYIIYLRELIKFWWRLNFK